MEELLRRRWLVGEPFRVGKGCDPLICVPAAADGVQFAWCREIRASSGMVVFVFPVGAAHIPSLPSRVVVFSDFIRGPGLATRTNR